MKKFKTLLLLFLTFFKIGLFTFGGGYAMIAVMEREFVEKKKWTTHEDFLDLIAIAESTPGPIAINSATYIGYKVGGVLGSIFATFGMVLPSLVIILTISLFFDTFLKFKWVQHAFHGIQAGVAFIILSAGIKMFKSLKKNALSLTLSILTVIALVCITLFAADFSSIFLILIGGIVGLIVYLIAYFKQKKNPSKKHIVKKGGKK